MVGVPLSQHKTCLPATTMEFMGITLDAVRMEARLPIDKVVKIEIFNVRFSQNHPVN